MRISPGRLSGQVTISGAKNSALKLLTASILTDEPLRLSNFPSSLSDIQIHVGMLDALGKTIEVGCSEVTIRQTDRPVTQSLEWTERSIRNTLLILGALTTRYGWGRVPLPGGCKLGDRKYDLHIRLLEKMGAKVWHEDNYLCAKSAGPLTGADIFLPIRSTGATENAILCGTLARGKTTVWNPHVRPEVMDLIELLRKMGAQITVHGQKCIEIDGVSGLRGADHDVIPDNMEALTWLIGSAITGGEVEIHNFPVHHLDVPLTHLRESGLRFFRGGNSIIARGSTPYPIEISTGPYPGINSDMQPLFAVYGAISEGDSKVVDLRFPGRYGYAEELAKMGMAYSVHDGILVIHGGKQLTGANVTAVDLRAGIALLLAALTADGETVIEDAWQITRGYDRLVEKLVVMGVDVAGVA